MSKVGLKAYISDIFQDPQKIDKNANESRGLHVSLVKEEWCSMHGQARMNAFRINA